MSTYLSNDYLINDPGFSFIRPFQEGAHNFRKAFSGHEVIHRPGNEAPARLDGSRFTKSDNTSGVKRFFIAMMLLIPLINTIVLAILRSLEMPTFKANQEAAATKIQKAFKNYKEKRIQKQTLATAEKQREVQRELQRELQRLNNLGLVTETRAKLEAETLQKKTEHLQNAAAMKIQGTFKSFAKRKTARNATKEVVSTLKDLKKLMGVEQTAKELKNSAAVKIQGTFKSFAKRKTARNATKEVVSTLKDLKKLMAVEEQIAKELKNSAAVKIQGAFRAFVNRKTARNATKEVVSTLKDLKKLMAVECRARSAQNLLEMEQMLEEMKNKRLADQAKASQTALALCSEEDSVDESETYERESKEIAELAPLELENGDESSSSSSSSSSLLQPKPKISSAEKVLLKASTNSLLRKVTGVEGGQLIGGILNTRDGVTKLANGEFAEGGKNLFVAVGNWINAFSNILFSDAKSFGRNSGY